MPQIEVQLRICVNIADDKKVTLGNLASAIKGQKIEAKALEEIIHALDTDLVEQYFGNIYGRGNGDKRYQRGGTSRKKPVTAVGKIDIKLYKVVDTGKWMSKGAGGYINTVFRPVEDIILFDGSSRVFSIFSRTRWRRI